ncbi:MAG TPA: cytochrome c3 family protein, partial [Candidatus Thermoplasmatota archaeon]
HPFVEEWSASGHGTAVASPAGRSACVQCHAGEDVLKAWGINVEYLEKPTLDDEGQHLGVTCAVCHDPHAKTEDAQLRFPIDALDEEENLCMKCHHKRGKPDPTTYRGAHSPEGPLVVGDAGWWPPNFTAPGGRLAGTHSSDRNPRLCAGCHVRAYSVSGPAGTVNMTGHSFQATPCVDGGGVPVNGECDDAQKSYKGCVAGNCHGSEAAARSIKAVAELRLDRLADELDLLVKNIPSTEFDETDSRYTSGEGAKFNVALARFHGTAVHNPFLMEALLIASIQQVKTEYGLSAQTGVSLVQEMTGN